MILLHGLFSSAQMNWMNWGQAQLLADAGFECLMPDLRAHGAAGVLRPGVRTYKPRRTRITERAARALVDQQQHARQMLAAGAAVRGWLRVNSASTSER